MVNVKRKKNEMFYGLFFFNYEKIDWLGKRFTKITHLEYEFSFEGSTKPMIMVVLRVLYQTSWTFDSDEFVSAWVHIFLILFLWIEISSWYFFCSSHMFQSQTKLQFRDFHRNRMSVNQIHFARARAFILIRWIRLITNRIYLTLLIANMTHD